MRLAIHPTRDVGHRAGRILAAEAALEALGIYGHRGPGTEDRRVTAISGLEGFTVLASDDLTAPLDLAAIAAEDGLSCVLAADVAPPPDLAARFAARGRCLLVAASLPGLAEALASRLPLLPGDGALLLAWTSEGKPGPRQVAVPFPDPVGACWGRRLPPRPGDPPSSTRVEVPLPGPWAGALARATTGRRRHRRQHLVAVADDRRHLEAIALAAGALLLARGETPPGTCRTADLAEAYLAECLGVGLEVATLRGRS
ncbi:MAG: hypothetical protein JW785_03250 [Acidimicrobiia bacterium]|nr:hypothetical protein [Acidimicrobiia bacterium]